MNWTETLDDIKTRLRLLFTRGRVRLVDPKETGEAQLLQVSGLAAELSDGVEHFQPFGLEAHPVAGAESFLLAVLGQRGQLIALVHDPRVRPDWLKPGETCLYSAQDQHIWLDKNDDIRIKATKLIAETEEAEITSQKTRLASKKVVLDCDDIALGGEGGARVARVGDLVRVGHGSSAGDHPIVGGSSKVTAR